MSKPETTPVESVSDPEEIQALKRFRTTRTRNELRDLVYRELVKTAHADARFRAAVEPLGFFAFSRVVDGICDAITKVAAAPPPLAVHHFHSCGAATHDVGDPA